MIRATIIFGSGAVNKYDETGIIPKDEDIDGCIDVVEFRTEAKMRAYCKGLCDADGWEKVISLDPVYTQTPDCDTCDHWRGFFSDKEGSVYCPDCGKRLDEPCFEVVTLNGHEFNARTLNVEGELKGSRISTETLNDMLLDDEGDYISEEARQVDETIKFYVPVDKITLPDSQLAAYINQNMK
ncbi:hypothetical protein IR083_07895 [Dysgonomonas sp. GY75]|uniref:hypothetical protein n=1 Tax=Dysgonomonas sp. GY75 TaxID=2780419 RepID=UPI001883F803|nr:hypothetical protein [Dysgonomonas sp. GY75]MBF0648739.1 hypothetical protein [Dysgonomonas sp. GY75]